MRNLIAFLVRNISWFLFIALELVCFYFIFNSNSYQKSVFLNSSNQISGEIFGVTSDMSSYFGLREENETLLQENTKLSYQVSYLKQKLAEINVESDSLYALFDETESYKKVYNLHLARVINNSTTRNRNFITINKGEKDGIEEDMGVISHLGVVGVVRATSQNYSVIQSVLNPDTKFSCKVLKSNVSGTLVWDGIDPRFAEVLNYPKFEQINKGDTIVSSGFSRILPEGIMIGTVISFDNQLGDGFYKLRIRLATDFSSLQNVIILQHKGIDERLEIENKVNNAKK